MSQKLILLRHGESKWNLENRFTGWTDVDLTKNGQNEAKNAGVLLSKNNIEFDLVYASYLKRAIKTLKICLKQLNKSYNEAIYHWRLNERHYGNLQGLNKSETAIKYGDEKVLKWRRSYDTRPPSMDPDDKNHPRHDILYKEIDPLKLPSAESLKDTLERVNPLWINQIIPQIKKGQNIMIVAHGNSLRAIVKILKDISNKDIINLNIPTGFPYIFEFDDNFDIKNDYFLGNQEEILNKIENISKQGLSEN
tara:strand:- start:3691 stop:4443 length:753 start_codon:yes stop_codon:yes gene_type:complete